MPLTTIAVALFSAFPAFENVQQSAQDLIFDNLVPQVGEAVADYLEGFAVNAGRLTSVGLLGLIVTSVMLLWTIEAAFNAIWRVREARPTLEAMGWTVREIPGAETAAILDPAVMVPEMRAFLEGVEG